MKKEVGAILEQESGMLITVEFRNEHNICEKTKMIFIPFITKNMEEISEWVNKNVC